MRSLPRLSPANSEEEAGQRERFANRDMVTRQTKHQSSLRAAHSYSFQDRAKTREAGGVCPTQPAVNGGTAGQMSAFSVATMCPLDKQCTNPGGGRKMTALVQEEISTSGRTNVIIMSRRV